MKRLLTLVAFFATLQASAQQVNPVPDYVFANRMSAGRNTVTDTAAYFSIGPRYGATRGMMPPMVVDTASFSANKRNGLLIFSIQKNKFLYWDSVGVKWAEMAGTGGSAITGSGVAGYMPEFTTTTNLDTTRLYHSAGRFAIGSTTTTNGVFNVYGGQSYFDTSLKVASFFLADDKKGNVAIGIDSTDIANLGWKSLTIQGASRRAQVELSNSSTGTSDVAGSIRGYNGSTLLGSIDIQADGATNKGKLSFITNDGSITARRLNILNNGEILINTDFDFGNYFLQVAGAIYNGGNLYNTTGAILSATSGNVGVGLTSPDAKFHVSNDFRMLGVFKPLQTADTGYYTSTFTGSNDGGGAGGFIYTSNRASKPFPFDEFGELIIQGNARAGYHTGISLVTGTTEQSVKLRVTSSGEIGINTTSPNASAQLDVSSTTKGFLPPRMTTTQRDAISSPAAGLIIYNTTTSKLQVYTTSWTDLH